MRGIVTQWHCASHDQKTLPPPTRMLTSIAEFPVRNERDVKAAAQRARLFGTLVNLPDRQRSAFGRAVREITQNVVRHSGNGRIEFRIDDSGDVSFIEALVSDSSDGQDEIASIVTQAVGPDCGLRRARRATDRLLLELTDSGKTVRAGIALSARFPTLDESAVADWAGILRTKGTQSALASTQRRSRDLADQLASVHRQRQELESDLHQTKSMNETLTLLSLVASKTDNAVVIMDGDGLVTWLNDAFIRMTGFAISDAVGARPDRLLSGPETSRESLREIEHAFQLGHGVNEEFLQYRREGTTSWISLSLTPIHDNDGAVSRWIGIGSDITKRKESERALKRARDAAEAASQMKGQFLANISHEIRIPMNAIIGMTDLSLCTDLDADQREYLTTVKQSAESLLELLNNVLDLSKIESGRLEIDEIPFDLRAAMFNTLKPLTFMAEQKGLTVDVRIASDIPACIVGDPMRLRQILVNLVGNAIKFTDKGRVEVAVVKQWETGPVETTDQRSAGEFGLQFTVADTGLGIKADKLDRIFEAFSQADASITRQFGGTGLGLTITSELLRLMKGRIWVQSEVGKGSRFHFTIRSRFAAPLEQQEVAGQLTITAADAAASDVQSSRRPKRILVADDHPANCRLIAKILEKRGHKMSFARNGHEVIRIFDPEEFDLVLMDVQMPDMDGYQATSVIRERERETQKHIPIIAVTAHAMQGDREACLAAGMDAYLSKPISAIELVTLVDSLSDNEVNLSASAATSTGFISRNGQRESEVLSTETFAADTTPGQSVRTFAAALARLDNDQELLREQMQFFMTDGPQLLKMMDAAMKNQDGPGLQIAAHRLKNLCATFDDNDAAALCAHVEMNAAAGFDEMGITPVLQLNSAVLQLLHSIEQYCRK